MLICNQHAQQCILVVTWVQRESKQMHMFFSLSIAVGASRREALVPSSLGALSGAFIPHQRGLLLTKERSFILLQMNLLH